MREEVETGLYPHWLRSHDLFFAQLGASFTVEWLRQEPFFFHGKAPRGLSRGGVT